jgi:hypothetical protein
MPLSTLKAVKNQYQNLTRAELIKQVKAAKIKVDCRRSTSDILSALISHNQQLVADKIAKQKAIEAANQLIDIELNRLSPIVKNCLGAMTLSQYNLISIKGRVAKINKLSGTQGKGFKAA